VLLVKRAKKTLGHEEIEESVKKKILIFGAKVLPGPGAERVA